MGDLAFDEFPRIEHPMDEPILFEAIKDTVNRYRVHFECAGYPVNNVIRRQWCFGLVENLDHCFTWDSNSKAVFAENGQGMVGVSG